MTMMRDMQAERQAIEEDMKRITNFGGLDAVLLLMHDKDMVVYPKESAWF